jgi:hypothetical protein
MTTITAHSLVGSSKRNCWSQAQQIVRDGYTVAVALSLKLENLESAIDLASIGGAIFEKFHDFGSQVHSAKEWKVFLEEELGSLDESIERDLVLGYVNDDQLWIWGEGKTGGLIKRGGNVVNITPPSGWGGGLSGNLVEGDILMLGTAESMVVCQGRLSALLPSSSLGEIIDEMGPLIHKHKSQEKIALVVMRIGGEATNRIITERAKLPDIVVKRMSEEPRRANLIIGSIIALGLVVLVFTGMVVRSNKEAKREYESVIERSVAMINEAEGVAGSNPERAKILLAQSLELLDLYIKAEPKASYLKSAQENLENIKLKEQQILRVKGVELIPTVELSVLRDGLRSDVMVSDNEGSLYFWDEQSRSILGIASTDLSKVSYPVENERYVRPFSVSNGVYTGISSGGVWVGDNSEQKVVIPNDEEWEEITQVATYGNNIYLLDRGKGEIWKYAASDAGYADRRRWFGAGIVLDLSRVVDWFIDGDVWLLTSSGKLEKYSRGVPAAFELTGFPSESESGALLDPIAVSVVEGKVYVLERGAKRVVVFDTDGKYMEQYVYEEFANATDMVVYGSKGYVLINNVIKEWEL